MATQDQGQTTGKPPGKTGTAARGFASMTQSAQREIARMGGAAVSGDREHMAKIGRKGGEASAESRAAASQARAAIKKASASRSEPRDGQPAGYGQLGNGIESDRRQ